MSDHSQALPPWYGYPPQEQHLEARQFSSLLSAASSVIASVFSPATTTDVPAPVETTPLPAAVTTPIEPAVPPTTTAVPAVSTTPVAAPTPIPVAVTSVADTTALPAAATSPVVQSTVVVETTATAPAPYTTFGPGVITSIPIQKTTPTPTSSTTSSSIPTLTPFSTTSPLATATAAADGNKGSSSGGSSKGKTLGIALGVSLGAVALGLLILALIFCLRRRRSRDDPFKRNAGSDNESFLDGGPASTMREQAGGIGSGGSGGHGGMGTIDALAAGAAAGGAAGAAANIARRSRDDGYGRNGQPGRRPRLDEGAPVIPMPHQLSGNRQNNGDYAYAGAADPFDDGRRAQHNSFGASSRHSLPLEAVSENPDDIAAMGADQPRRSFTDTGPILLMPGPRPGDRRSGGPPPVMGRMPRRSPGYGPSNGNGRRPPYGPSRPPPPQYYENGYGPGSYGPGRGGGPSPPEMNPQDLSSSPPGGGILGANTPPRRLSQASPTSPGGSAAAVKRKPVSGGSISPNGGGDGERVFDFGFDGMGGGPGPAHEDQRRFYGPAWP